MGESVSFGRFTTESLEWEKWSTFSQNQNRYVEEAERFSKPGSVAQKKAFFEEHYKKLAAQKAAALLEQARIDEAESAKPEDVVSEENAENLNVESSLPRSENKACVGNSMQNQFEGVDNDDTKKDLSEKKGCNFGMEVLQSMDKSTYPIISDRDNIVNPMNSKASLRKKRSKAKSLPMSVKFALIRQISRLNSLLMKKFETTKTGSGSSVASKDIWIPLTTPTKACKNELQKHPSFSPLSEKKRNIMKSPTISSQLSLKTDERTARRNKERSHKKNRKLRLCFCFKPRPIPEFNKEREDSNRGKKEDSLTLTPGSRVTSRVQSKGSLSSESVITYENMSPNIQNGVKNERNN
ncbi:uncharacterized protein LOC131611428 [Vicia villosa]|uniref:uncharacterized protein LOC131611428 n=1 Tax=Vicia villosa TaxID=3911 RepID=UPI00273BEC36|nr:uncharacterized protein LOC131611428 [Vicia villosa]